MQVTALQRHAGNRAIATLLRAVGGWRDAAEGSGNEGESVIPAPAGGIAFRRIPVEGISGASGIATDRAIVLIPASVAPGQRIDVLLHLHGHPYGGPGGYVGGPTDTDYPDQSEGGKPRASPQADDIDEYRIGPQLAAAGRPIAGILPQGIGKSDFGKGESKAFDADVYIRSVFDRLGALGAWNAARPPEPGAVAFSGHSGADAPMTRMLTSGQAPKDLQALFLFDTMWPGAGHVETIWKYVKGRLEDELATLTDLRDRAARDAEQQADMERSDGGRGPGAEAVRRAEAEGEMARFVSERGFRLFNVHGGGTYKPQSDTLERNIDAWFATRRVRAIVGGPGSRVRDAWRANFAITRSTDRGEGTHMRILHHDEHLRQAVGMLGR